MVKTAILQITSYISLTLLHRTDQVITIEFAFRNSHKRDLTDISSTRVDSTKTVALSAITNSHMTSRRAAKQVNNARSDSDVRCSSAGSGTPDANTGCTLPRPDPKQRTPTYSSPFRTSLKVFVRVAGSTRSPT